MVQFGEVVDEVSRRTKRPDKVDEIKGGINAAVSFFATANFPNDLVENPTFAISSTAYAQSFAINIAPFVNFKVMRYMRPSGYRKYLAWRDPSRIFNGGCETLDCYYRSGVNIVFKLSNLQSLMTLGYYSYHSVLVNNTDTDWILDELGEAVKLHARSKIMRDIGEDTEANNNIKEALLLWEAYKNSVAEVQG